MKVETDNEILILDFDHTLFLFNATEEYLNSVEPRTLCALVLALLDWLKVWNLFSGEDNRVVSRDAIRVIAVSICFPWSYFLYKKRIASLLKEHLNAEILGLLVSKPWEKVVIVSSGFDFIVKPLLDQINIQADHLLCSSIFPTQGSIGAAEKRAYLQQTLTVNELNQATFISNNPEDQGLKGMTNQFVSCESQHTQQFRAGQDVYIPFVYTHASKRGNSNHVFNVIICDDYTIVVLAYILFNAISIQLFISLLLLVLSFWFIYEICYFENDLYELKYESKHKNLEVIEYIKKVQHCSLEKSAWLWAIGFSCLGLLLLPENLIAASSPILSYGFLSQLLIWMSWLVAARLVFRVYTYSSFHHRVILYPVLQLFRLAGPVLFLPITLYGAFLIVAQAMNRWFYYLMYRTGGDPKVVSNSLVRHIVFVILVVMLAVITKDISILISSQFLVILSWSILRGNLKIYIDKLMESGSAAKPPKISG